MASKKMSKSYRNYIALDAKPDQMFGQLMSIPDKLINKYFTLLTNTDRPRAMKARDAKLLLAQTIVADLHSPTAAAKAASHFEDLFAKKKKPSAMPKLIIKNKSIDLVNLLVKADVSSKTEARRLIKQGAVRINDQVTKDINKKINSTPRLYLANWQETFL